MSNYYNLNEIVTATKKEIERKAALLEAWRGVSFPTKKDGSQFANLAKNINGAKLSAVSYAMQPGENELTIYTHSNSAGYINDCIRCYELVKDLKEQSKAAKTANYLPKCTYLEQVYSYDLDDIKAAVQARISTLENSIKSLKAQLEILPDCYNAFKGAFSDAVDKLCAECAASDPEYSGNKNFIYYAILDTIKNRFPYC